MQDLHNKFLIKVHKAGDIPVMQVKIQILGKFNVKPGGQEFLDEDRCFHEQHVDKIHHHQRGRRVCQQALQGSEGLVFQSNINVKINSDS